MSKAFQRARNRTAKKFHDPEIFKVRLYDLRHFYGSMLYHKTKDLLFVKVKMGHRSISSTMRYLHRARVAQFLYQKVPFIDLDVSALRGLLVLIPAFFLIVSAYTQRYIGFFDSLLIFIYIFLFLASLYYTYSHRFGWSMWVVIISLIFSTIVSWRD
jgi:hypothetical protein